MGLARISTASQTHQFKRTFCSPCSDTWRDLYEPCDLDPPRHTGGVRPALRPKNRDHRTPTLDCRNAECGVGPRSRWKSVQGHSRQALPARARHLYRPHHPVPDRHDRRRRHTLPKPPRSHSYRPPGAKSLQATRTAEMMKVRQPISKASKATCRRRSKVIEEIGHRISTIDIIVPYMVLCDSD